MKKEVTQLDELLKRLQTEGVEQAKLEADKIINAAKLEAASITQEAEKKSQELHSHVQNQLNNKRESDQKRLKLAARDLTLKLNEDLRLKFSQFLEKNCNQTLDPALLKLAIKEIASSIGKESKISVYITEQEQGKLTEQLLGSFAQEIKQEIELKDKAGIASGFEISIEGESRYFEFTPEAISAEIVNLLGKGLSDLFQPFADEEES